MAKVTRRSLLVAIPGVAAAGKLPEIELPKIKCHPDNEYLPSIRGMVLVRSKERPANSKCPHQTFLAGYVYESNSFPTLCEECNEYHFPYVREQGYYIEQEYQLYKGKNYFGEDIDVQVALPFGGHAPAVEVKYLNYDGDFCVFFSTITEDMINDDLMAELYI